MVLIAYSALILYYLTGIQGGRAAEAGPAGESLTIIVPFRDESEHLGGLVESLKAQDYPQNKYQVLLVNDHSGDGSGALARSLAGNDPRFEVLDLPEGTAGKKAAIARAIGEAAHPWILQTDADCLPGKDFIHSHMSFLRNRPADLVAGMVSTAGETGRFIHAFECMDLLALAGASAGSFARGKPLMCSAANLLYRKQLYLDTRDFDPADKGPSGDDMFLLIGARKLHRTAGFNTDPHSLVYTAAAEDLKGLFRQRIRWGGKTPAYGMPGIQAVALLVAFSAAGAMLVPLWIFVLPGTWAIWLAALMSKFSSDLAMLYRMTGLTGQRKVLRWFLPAWLLYQPFLLTAAAGSLLTGTSWKDRKVRGPV